MDKKRTGESLKDLLTTEVNSNELKSRDAKTLNRQRAKASKRQDVKEENKRKHTIYLSPEQSKKLRLYAVENNMKLSEIIERLVKKNL